MKIKQLSNFIFFVTAGGALLLSILISIVVYFLAQNQAEKDSQTMSKNLMSAVYASASAAAFSAATFSGSSCRRKVWWQEISCATVPRRSCFADRSGRIAVHICSACR